MRVVTHDGNKMLRMTPRLLLVFMAACAMLAAGCQEWDTLKREIRNKLQKPFKAKTFTPRDGITIRPCSLYQTANPNSEVLKRLPAETPVHLVDGTRDWYRVRTGDGREGYVEQKVVGGQEIIVKTVQLRGSIEGMQPQAEGITKTKANFRLDPGRSQEIIEVLPPGKKFEMYERVVTVRGSSMPDTKPPARGRGTAPDDPADDFGSDSSKKDVWYKVKIEDGRVGYLFTHNIKFTPPEDIERAVPFLRLVGWRTVNTKDDPDRGAKNNYIAAYAPIGKDAGCDYTRLYFMNWNVKLKKRGIGWQLRLAGILPITDYHFDGKPGFSVRYLHPTKKDKLVLANFVFSQGRIRKVSEEEIPNHSAVH